MIAYIAELNRQIAIQAPPAPPLSLRQRFVDWHRSLPAVSRNRFFSMSEFEAALKTQCKHISPVLLDLDGELCAEVGDGEGERRRIMGVSKPPLLH